MVTALFVARFQPFHLGHKNAIENLLKEYDRVIIAVGSTNKLDERNPFSYEERRKMAKASLRGSCSIIAVPDMASDRKWAECIRQRAKFGVVATGNPWTRKCFRGCKVIKPNLLKPRLYSATRIRYLIRKGGKWEHLVPEGSARIIKEHYRIKRLPL